MTRVSKHKLSKKVEQELFDQFSSLFVAAGDKHLPALMSAMLSPTEQIMLIKRLAIVVLLKSEFSTYQVAKQLHVSDQTVRVVKKEMKAGRYDPVFQVVKKKSFNKQEFWDTLDQILSLGMPRYGTSLNSVVKKW